MAPFPAEVVTAILTHMNTDHLDDNVLIARAFLDPAASAARMTGLDGSRGYWSFTVDGEEREGAIDWESELTERPQIRQEVVRLHDEARALLGEPQAPAREHGGHGRPGSEQAGHAPQGHPAAGAAPVEPLSFSAALRARTRNAHGTSEHAGFMTELMSGNGSRADYVALLVQHYFIYDALESGTALVASDPIAAAFLSPQLTRLPAIEADLEFLIGPDWRDVVRPLDATRRYATRIRVVASSWPAGFVAHHYTRYLGDLSGGQIIRTLMQRQFGFETNGVGFYLFDQIAKPREFKERYREQLDAAGWSQEERERVIDEVLTAYRFNTELFAELERARDAA